MTQVAAATYVPCVGAVETASVILPGSYDINCDITVPSGDTLQVDPGTVLKFDSDDGITVQGTLDAVGTSAAPVTLTSVNDNSVGGATGNGTPVAGSWNGINGNASTAVYLQYAHMDYATFGVNCVGSTGPQGPYDITHTAFRSIEFSAVACYYDNSTASPLTIEDDVAVNVGDSADPAFYVYSSTVSPGLLGGNSATGGYPYFALNSDVLDSGSLPHGGPTWLLQGINVVASLQSLTLPVGTLLKFGSAGVLVVQGSLTAVGTAASPIIFTSVKDSLGGASGTGAPAAGDWWGIESENGAPAVDVEYAHVSYATIGIACGGAGGGKITHSVFTSISGPAVESTSNTPSTVEDNTAVDTGNRVQPAFDFDGGFMDPQLVAGNSARGGYPYFAVGGLSFDSGTLPLGGPTWIFEGGDTIPAGQLLTLGPGTLLKFGSGAYINVIGGFKAVGTKKVPIHFTSVNDNLVGGATGNGRPTPGSWSGISTDVPSTFDLQYAQLDYASTGVSCVGSAGPSIISHDTFAFMPGSAVSCIYANGSTRNPVPLTIEDNTAKSAGSKGNPAFYIYSSTVNPSALAGNSAVGGYPFFALDSDTINSGILPLGGPVWIFDRTETVPTGQTLTLPPGSILKFGSAAQLTVVGTLISKGSKSKPIVFTSVKDTFGGKSGIGAPAPGDWTGIVLNSGEKSTGFDYSVFEYASTAVDVALLDLLSVTHSVFSYNIQAFEVGATTTQDEVLLESLNALPCTFPYYSAVNATTSYFGVTGVASVDINISSVLGDPLSNLPHIGGDLATLYGSINVLKSLAQVELGPSKGNTVPWSIWSCVKISPLGIPVTAVVAPIPPEKGKVVVYPLTNTAFKQK